MSKDEFEEAAKRHQEYMMSIAPKRNWWMIGLFIVLIVAQIGALVTLEMGMW